MKSFTVSMLFLSLMLSVPGFAKDKAASTDARTQAFQKKMMTFTSKQASIKYAHTQIMDVKSDYRYQSVEFLREIKDEESIPLLRKFLKDKDINTFVIYALGDLQAFEATQDLISLLDHPYPNVRGNAFSALNKIHPLEVPQGYVHQKTKPIRKSQVAKIQKWWDDKGKVIAKNYKRDLHKDEQDKERAWNQHAKTYLQQK